MSNQQGLIEPSLQQDSAIEIKESPAGIKPLYLFHEHFSCADHDHGPNISPKIPQFEPSDLWEADTYRYEFNLAMFLRSLIVFVLSISGLGLPITLYLIISDSKFLSNLYSIGHVNGFIIVFGWINSLILIFSLYQGTFLFTDATSLLYFTEVFFLTMMGVSFNCYLNKKILPLLDSVELSEKSQEHASISSFQNFGGMPEFKRTVLRLNIDASSFFMTFLEKTDGEEPFKRNPDFIPAINIKQEGDKLILDKQIQKADLLAEAVEFEEAVFNYKFLTKATRYDQNKASGLRYAEEILSAYETRFRFYQSLGYLATILTVAMSFMDLDGSDGNSEGGFVKKYIVKGCALFIIMWITMCVLDVTLNSAMVLWIRLDFLKGLSELISEEKPKENSIFRMNCSMINIFDPESLRTWASLRMVFMNMSGRRLEASSLGTSMVISIQLVGLSILGYFYFTAEGLQQKAFFLQYIIFFGIPTLIYMMFVLLFIYYGSQVNNQYQEHIYLLKKLKMTIFKLFAMYPILNGEGSVQPSTYLYARGLGYLRQSFGEATKEVLDEELQKINEAYGEVIEELETEERYSPLKLLGIPMTNSFVTSVLGSILTVIMIPGSKFLSELTGWG